MKFLNSVDNIPFSLIWGIEITKPENEKVSYHNSIEIPCYIGCSPNASINFRMLANILTFKDMIELFDQLSGMNPFMLSDGHHSENFHF